MLLPIFLLSAILAVTAQPSTEAAGVFTIEGRVELRKEMIEPPNWKANSKVLVNYGEYVAFVKEDGSFVVEGIPSGSYIVEVSNVDYIFEPVRVDVNSKGKARGRRLNLLQPNTVDVIPYPLVIVARQPTRYFRPREEWRITDALMNPMILMVGVAFILMVVTPKLTANDPELAKEMEKVQLPKMDVPDMADMLANMFGGEKAGKTKAKKVTGKTR
uniref:EMC7_beta-sandw domain-containing protein n=1 Tax=Panagrellus redivivus TaxID=6233 RepID=A0A7E4W3L1_PANRE